MNKDYRRHQRIRHPITTKIEYTDSSGKRSQFEGKLEDISASGAGVILPRSFAGLLAVRSRVRVTLVRKRDKLKLEGYVARLGITEEGKPILGLEFDKSRYEVITNLVGFASMILELSEAVAKEPSLGPAIQVL